MTMLIGFSLLACDDDEYFDNTPPTPPRNVKTILGDNTVDIYWDHNQEGDVAGYNVYYAFGYYDRYTLLGNTGDNYFIDFGAENGVTYYYAIAAYDYNGNESELSYDMAIGVPRPEGFNQSIFDYNGFPQNSGYDLDDFLVVPYNDLNTDFFFENYNRTFFINVWEDTDIQDMGETYDIYDIGEAPLNGWVPIQPNENVKYVRAFVGHTYVIWTWDNHFAKIRISLITNERMVFDWAYQTVEGEPLLKGKGKVVDRKELPNQVIKNY